VRGRVRYTDELRHASPLAHPIVSGDTVTNVVSKLGPRAEVLVCRHQATSRQRAVLARWTTFAYPYIHSFGLTQQTAILIDHPLRLHPLDLLWSNGGVIEHFKWQRGSATRLVLLNLRDGSARTHETEPLFCFHTVHAFETAEHTVLDLLAYDDATIVRELSLPDFAAGFPNCKPQLLRLMIDRRSGKVARHVLSDTRFEFPQLDYQYVGAGETNHVFGCALHRTDARLRSEIVRISTSSQGSEADRRFSEGEYAFGEPVFVGDPTRTRAGQGVLLTVGADDRGSALFVLDASSFEVLAHARFETPLPIGFHGSFLRVSATR
jgi:carotenoid cleavage dioxygenase-like enzyme